MKVILPHDLEQEVLGLSLEERREMAKWMMREAWLLYLSVEFSQPGLEPQSPQFFVLPREYQQN